MASASSLTLMPSQSSWPLKMAGSNAADITQKGGKDPLAERDRLGFRPDRRTAGADGVEAEDHRIVVVGPGLAGGRVEQPALKIDHQRGRSRAGRSIHLGDYVAAVHPTDTCDGSCGEGEKDQHSDDHQTWTYPEYLGRHNGYPPLGLLDRILFAQLRREGGTTSGAHFAKTDENERGTSGCCRSTAYAVVPIYSDLSTKDARCLGVN